MRQNRTVLSPETASWKDGQSGVISIDALKKQKRLTERTLI
jgi:hypothetical protein